MIYILIYIHIFLDLLQLTVLAALRLRVNVVGAAAGQSAFRKIAGTPAIQFDLIPLHVASVASLCIFYIYIYCFRYYHKYIFL